MKVIHDKESGSLIKAWTEGVELDGKAIEQLRNVARLPFVYKWVAAMPDSHWGLGATVGSVIATQGAVIPAAVGVDIGCGMIAAQTNLTKEDLPSDLFLLRKEIEKRVPHGRTNNGAKGDRGAWFNIPKKVSSIWDSCLASDYSYMCDKHPKLAKGNDVNHLGTLGTGNHFIEICLDESGGVWIMLHSGSRGVGNRIGQYFIDIAKKQMEKWFISLVDANLAFLPEGTEQFEDYIEAVDWAQVFASKNREIMLEYVLDAMDFMVKEKVKITGQYINCHHNYISMENHYGKNVWVTRKGAVRARVGDKGIIPGSMGAKSYITEGLGNIESFCSSSHGAGRVMSRGEAKKIITIDDHIRATMDVECRKDADVIDESPAAYKDIDDVMDAQKDLVKTLFVLKQVLCVKG